MKWKDFLYFRRGSKTAVILLMILIVLTLVLNILLSYRDSTSIVVVQNDSIVQAFDQFLRELKRIDASPPGEREDLSKAPAAGPGAFADDAHTYNPPRGSTMPRGASPAGDTLGYTRQPSDFGRFPRVEKLGSGETILLNSTDTAEWKKIPGIGSAYSARIVEYRERLGGFVRKEQLMEVYGIDAEMYARIAPYIEPGGNCKRLKINSLEFKELLRHPYLNYKQVAAIMNLRRRKGNITSIQELGMLDEFTSGDTARLEPYLEF